MEVYRVFPWPDVVGLRWSHETLTLRETEQVLLECGGYKSKGLNSKCIKIVQKVKLHPKTHEICSNITNIVIFLMCLVNLAVIYWLVLHFHYSCVKIAVVCHTDVTWRHDQLANVSTR